MLKECCSRDELEKFLCPREQWRPFPRAMQRDQWKHLLDRPLARLRRDQWLKAARESLREPWPPLPASGYMAFARTGNRSDFEALYMPRRSRLAVLVLAECFEHEGEFLDAIADALWFIVEETSWSLPAHAERFDNDPLPRHDRHTVDLFACETAMALAETLYLLEDELSSLSTSLVARTREAVLTRVTVPVEQRDDIGWFSGFNNWTPWCAANTLGSAMYLLDDIPRLAALTDKLNGIVDRFIGNYGDDGGCNEGPGYWNVAAGALFLYLDTLSDRTGGAVSVFDRPLIRNMAHYIVSVHLDGPWFANFADAQGRGGIKRGMAYRFGELVGDDTLMNLAALAAHGWKPGPVGAEASAEGKGLALPHRLRELFWLPADLTARPERHAVNSWLPDLQVAVVRESPEADTGLVLASKAGHNNESHNHNDIGQFILMLNGEPFVIDIGVEAYTAATFSNRRYTIWCIRGSAHNVPMVNGEEQAPGEEHRATDVSFEATPDNSELRMHLEEAYPESAGLMSLTRSLRLGRSPYAQIVLRDEYVMQEGRDGVMALPLFTPCTVRTDTPDMVLLETSTNAVGISYDSSALSVQVEDAPLSDAKLRTAWGDSLSRITFNTVKKRREGHYELSFASA